MAIKKANIANVARITPSLADDASPLLRSDRYRVGLLADLRRGTCLPLCARSAMPKATHASIRGRRGGFVLQTLARGAQSTGRSPRNCIDVYQRPV